MIELLYLGGYREIVIVLEEIIIILCWQFAIYFLHKYYKNTKEQKLTRIELDWAIFFVAFGFTHFFYQFADFYLVNHELFSFYGYMSLVIGVMLFVIHSEKIETIKTKKILPIITSFLIVIFIISYFYDPKLPQTIATLAIFPAIIIILYFIFSMFRRLRGKFRFYTIGLFGGLLILFIGHLGATDFARSTFGLSIRVFADLLMILGICSLALFFNLLPSLSEVDWQEKLKYILVMNKNGICLYNEDFREKTKINPRLLAAALFSIREFLDLMAKSKKLRTLEKENEFFLIDYGEKITGVLVATELLDSLKYLLKKFVKEFESFFSDTLDSWTGDIRLFHPTSNLTSKIFKKF